jgi:DNA-directed RNA polymerase specialized sigma24 family protein
VTSDAELISGSLRDPALFAGVFDRHYSAIAGFLRRRVERSLADELAAETFLRAFDGRARYDVTRADARPWLFGIAANLLARHRRVEQRRLRAFARAAGSVEERAWTMSMRGWMRWRRRRCWRPRWRRWGPEDRSPNADRRNDRVAALTRCVPFLGCDSVPSVQLGA